MTPSPPLLPVLATVINAASSSSTSLGRPSVDLRDGSKPELDGLGYSKLIFRIPADMTIQFVQSCAVWYAALSQWAVTATVFPKWPQSSAMNARQSIIYTETIRRENA